MHLLRGVDQQEEERERARGDRGTLERERGHLLEQRVERGRVGLAMATRAAGLAERLDALERLLALEAADDPAERCGEPAHVLVQRDVFAANSRSGGHAR